MCACMSVRDPHINEVTHQSPLRQHHSYHRLFLGSGDEELRNWKSDGRCEVDLQLLLPIAVKASPCVWRLCAACDRYIYIEKKLYFF